MKNLLAYYDPNFTTKLEDAPVPEHGADEVLIKVVAAGSNPKDWKHPMPNYFNNKLNQGDDVGGIVEAVGSKVKNFHKGDRVAGFHEMDTPRGAYAEYTVCPENTVFHIPESMSFEEASTMPLAIFTAAVGLYRNLNLPMPFGRSDDHSPQEKTPLIVNAASSAVGAFAVKLAKLNPIISPVIGIAGGSAAYAKEVGCDIVVDYRTDNVADQLKQALGGKKCRHIFDASNSITSVNYLIPVLERDGIYTSTTGLKVNGQDEALQKAGVWHEQIWVGSVHESKLAGGKMFGAVMSQVFEWAIEEGRLNGHPYETVEGGLDGVYAALVKLRDRKGGNAKFVTRIADTKGL
ncbi:GroES-like protein [Rhizodiscina lignyota]|uniref:GroES-like protein n=1 Tax=Rhizodiscina lignyota TaxID=1504668 RepID=A0A9P4I724_9PEZI|nr:GroES-like protein [Rhizodiscina lignyota]